MIEDRDIWQAAQLMIRQHGHHAPMRAAQRADQLFDEGDFDDATDWRRILAAIEELARTKLAEGERVN